MPTSLHDRRAFPPSRLTPSGQTGVPFNQVRREGWSAWSKPCRHTTLTYSAPTLASPCRASRQRLRLGRGDTRRGTPADRCFGPRSNGQGASSDRGRATGSWPHPALEGTARHTTCAGLRRRPDRAGLADRVPQITGTSALPAAHYRGQRAAAAPLVSGNFDGSETTDIGATSPVRSTGWQTRFPARTAGARIRSIARPWCAPSQPSCTRSPS